MNRHRFKSDMEAAWELRPGTDVTPESRSHPHRFHAPSKPGGAPDSAKPSKAAGEGVSAGGPETSGGSTL